MRTKLSKIAHIHLILIIGVIGVQTITSCSGDEGGGGGDPSSSSRGGSSSPSASIIPYCDTLTYEVLTPCEDGIAEIGDQVWQKCNLNVEPSVGNSRCYCNKPENCAKYGRLYDWEAAMSVCPSGWHLPTTTDWDTLLLYFEDIEDRYDRGKYDVSCSQTLLCYINGCSSHACYYSEKAGRYLKSASGWRGWDENGTDDYGFSALPGGSCGSDSNFAYMNRSGYW